MKYHFFNRVGECTPFKRGINWSGYKWTEKQWCLRVSLFHKYLTTTLVIGRFLNTGFGIRLYRELGGWKYPHGTFFGKYQVWMLSEENHDDVAKMLRKPLGY